MRRTVTRRADPNVRFADAEAAFAANSPQGIPGRELFYEHVHLTWEGNWLLARAILQPVERILPATLTGSDSAQPDWPSAEECARTPSRPGRAIERLPRK